MTSVVARDERARRTGDRAAKALRAEAMMRFFSSAGTAAVIMVQNETPIREWKSCSPFSRIEVRRLRRPELRSLAWGDVNLDVIPARIASRAENTKAKRADRLVLHPQVADALRTFMPYSARPSERIQLPFRA